MGDDIKDIDLVVDLPEGGIVLAEWMKGTGRTKDVILYKHYGTAMFKFMDEEIEVVQTRKEIYPDPNSRNPVVSYGSISEDANRRDLTINSLYWNISEKKLIDPTEKGVKDIFNKVIRTTSTPDIIFSDDPLRMLRCIRFSARLGWKIDENTKEGIKKNSHRLSIISQERITSEIDKMLTYNSSQSITDLKETGLLDVILPELLPFYPEILKSLGLKTNDLIINLCLIFKYLPIEKTEEILKRFRYPNNTIQTIKIICGYYKLYTANKSPKENTLREWQYNLGEKYMNIVSIITEDMYFQESIDKLGNRMYEYKLPISGNDLLKKGYKGQEVGEALREIKKAIFINPDITIEEIWKTLKKN